MAVAGNRQAGCEGCGRTVSLDELTTVTMPDGDRVACCPTCAPHARAAANKSRSLDQRRGTCDGCTGEFPEAELREIALNDGLVVACCSSCAASAPDEDGATGGSSAGPNAGGRAGEQNLCNQCHEWVDEELFRVTTIDDRTEHLCTPCTERAEENGIVKDVALRTARARELLGVEEGASDDEIRAAFHEQVKRAHPDRKSGSASAFQLVTDAYDRLRKSD
ncbi:J domain-containing protein [Halosolutus gelatinilyticus]|uniref:J domain-containing protein n=1 Tax=Halosolutus gelatinilyticus TaxID=2931975 RepID=UPI001FF3A39C|nr:J domain-containing protein [Halosolutus gelatinilyticus]